MLTNTIALFWNCFLCWAAQLSWQWYVAAIAFWVLVTCIYVFDKNF